MQVIELDFEDNQVLFCPVTGNQVLIPDEPFEESQAMLFCYLPEYEVFEFVTPEIEKAFKENNEDFKTMLGTMLKKKDNHVLFKLCYLRGFESLIAFDMGYKRVVS